MSAATALPARLLMNAKLLQYCSTEVVYTTYYQVVNLLIEMYAAEEIIGKTDRLINGFVKP